MAKTNKDNDNLDNPHRSTDVVDVYEVMKRRKIGVATYLSLNSIKTEQELFEFIEQSTKTSNYVFSERFINELLKALPVNSNNSTSAVSEEQENSSKKTVSAKQQKQKKSSSSSKS